MDIDETKQYVDWAGLRYYDQRVKAYIDSKFANSDDQNQFRADLEQLEDRIQTLADNFTTDKAHIYEHIEACKKSSATKEELASSMAALRQEIKTLTGVDLSKYATKEFVEDKIRDIGTVELPDNLVTTDDIQHLVTREELDEEIGKIAPPDVDLTSLATKEELSAVEAKIPSVKGLASETYVDEKVANIKIPEVPTNISQLENDAGYLTNIPKEYVTEEELNAKGYIQNLDGYATEDFVNQQFENFELPDLTNYATIDDVKNEVTKLVAEAPEQLDTLSELAQAIEEQSEVLDTFATKSQLEGLASEQFVSDEISKIQIPDTSKFITTIPEEYVTDLELDARGYLTEHQSLEGLATEQFVNNKFAELDCVTTADVESLVDEKIEEAITDGATVSSISYGTF